ncbi:hypothetical protein FOL47_000811 [Perkinsus chesapeaki]|uniref:Uncharacterized protein n=1 Tax=Perkinsus chesapeaki TaxID=330153 RepID=A0A7J6KUF0_PERCH|nr:hypothetical protein FOL47_000811 [Perkinsus chesapeaki]
MKSLVSLDVVDGPFKLTPAELEGAAKSLKLESLYLAGVDLVEGRDSVSCGKLVKWALESRRLMEVVLHWADPTCIEELVEGEMPVWKIMATMRGSTLSHWRWFRFTHTGVMAFQYGDPPEFAEKMFLQLYDNVDDGESLLKAEWYEGHVSYMVELRYDEVPDVRCLHYERYDSYSVDTVYKLRLDLPFDFYDGLDDNIKVSLDQIGLRVMVALADRRDHVRPLEETPPSRPPRQARRSSLSSRESLSSYYAFTESTRASTDGRRSSP